MGIGRGLQHVYRDKERALRNLAVGVLPVRLSQVATKSKVPGRWCWVSRVGVIGSNLAIGAHAVKHNQSNRAGAGYNWIPNSHDDSNKLGEKEEKGDDGDGDIEISEPVTESLTTVFLLMTGLFTN